MFIHIGTNNLDRGIWENEKKDFIQLIVSAIEKFISSEILYLRYFKDGIVTLYTNKAFITIEN